MTNTRTIRVTGKGQLKVKPDTMRITMTLTDVYREYSESLSMSSKDTKALKVILKQFGFQSEDIKTLRFNVDSEYESYRENGEYKNRFVGYRFTHVMKVEFPFDNDRLGKVLYALAHCHLEPEFRLSYTVADPEARKNELLAKAIHDAKEKAAVLTTAAGVTLGSILNIDYSWGEIEFEYSPMYKAMPMDANIGAAPSYDLDIEPDDIETADNVTVVWEVEG